MINHVCGVDTFLFSTGPILQNRESLCHPALKAVAVWVRVWITFVRWLLVLHLLHSGETETLFSPSLTCSPSGGQFLDFYTISGQLQEKESESEKKDLAQPAAATFERVSAFPSWSRRRPQLRPTRPLPTFTFSYISVFCVYNQWCIDELAITYWNFNFSLSDSLPPPKEADGLTLTLQAFSICRDRKDF